MFCGCIKVLESLGGFGIIGFMFGNEWFWECFWIMIVVLFLILAFMNFLFILVFDGGYVMFFFYEMIIGCKFSDKFLE